MKTFDARMAEFAADLDADDAAERRAHNFREEGKNDELKLKDVCRAIVKLQLVAIKLRYNKNYQRYFEEACQAEGCPGPWTVPRSMKVRWNSEYVQMEAGYRLRDPILAWQKDRRVKWDKKNCLSKKDFEVFRQLSEVLKPLYEFTQRFSKAGSPYIAEGIPVLDDFSNRLDRLLYNPDIPAVIHNALVFGWRMCQRYYSLSDEGIWYRMSIILHPSYGVEYLEKAGWSKAWIDTAIKITQDYYWEHYGSRAEESDDDIIIEEPEQDDDLFLSPSEQMLRAAMASSAPPPTTLTDLIERTARAPRQYNFLKSGKARVKDPKSYWEGKLAAEGSGGNRLAEFACDLYNCPASSIDVERSFSLGRCLVSEFQHSLSARRIASLLTVSFYSKHGIIKSGLLAMRQREEKRQAATAASAAAAADSVRKRAAEEAAARPENEASDDEDERPSQRRRLSSSLSSLDDDDE
ncbi:hypothetical protein JCM8097_008855 [Rhodosporidiobolus ruineniae]